MCGGRCHQCGSLTSQLGPIPRFLGTTSGDARVCSTKNRLLKSYGTRFRTDQPGGILWQPQDQLGPWNSRRNPNVDPPPWPLLCFHTISIGFFYTFHVSHMTVHLIVSLNFLLNNYILESMLNFIFIQIFEYIWFDKPAWQSVTAFLRPPTLSVPCCRSVPQLPRAQSQRPAPSTLWTSSRRLLGSPNSRASAGKKLHFRRLLQDASRNCVNFGWSRGISSLEGNLTVWAQVVFQIYMTPSIFFVCSKTC